MGNRELMALEDPGEWDDDRAHVHPPSPSARAIVSVPFDGDDFDLVSDAARSEGMKTSEFIRAAALERSIRQGSRSPVPVVGGRAGS